MDQEVDHVYFLQCTVTGLIKIGHGKHEDKYKSRTPWLVRSTASIVIIERIRLMYIRTRTGISPERRVIAWIRNRIHPYCWGTSDRFKQGFTQTSSRQILDFFGCLRFGLPQRFLPTPRNGDFMAHVTGQLILYFQSNGRRARPRPWSRLTSTATQRDRTRGRSSSWSG